MSDIFLSYASADRERVLPLVNVLESQGLDVWWDRDIAHGDNYHRVIEKALGAARCAIVIWSESSVGSEWVVNEASEARRRGVLVPVLFDAVDPPLEFRHLQTARLVQWTGSASDPELQKLLNAAKGVIQRSGTPSPARTAAPQQAVRKSWWETPAGWAAGAGTLLVGVALLVIAFRWGGGEADTPAGGITSQSALSAETSQTANSGGVDSTAAPKGRTNLLDLAEGAKIVGASEAGWKSYIFGERLPACSIIATGGFVVFAFPGERPARFDALGVYVESADSYNVKTVEVQVSDSTDQGPFRKVATFEVPNYRNERQTYHQLKFNEVTARYVKLVIPEFRRGRDMPNGNVCTMELYGSLQ